MAKLRNARDMARAFWRRLWRRLRPLFYLGTSKWCPVCERGSRKFVSFGTTRRENAQCVHCNARERHRFVWVFFARRTDLFDGASKKVLHVAPEHCFERRLKDRLGPGYLTADLLVPAMVRMDITEIQYPPDHFDVIYCSHVLEHVVDDRKAMREFHRVLKPKGWAVLLVPITAKKTFEDPTVVDPAERLRLYGQANHVRRYGPDYVDRLRESGFNVEISRVSDLCDEVEAARMGLPSGRGAIYYCTKA